MDEKLLSVKDLKVSIQTSDGIVQAVNGASFDVFHNQTFALLGESGCGKSMTALSILQLLPFNAKTAGSLEFKHHNLAQLPEIEMRQIRGSSIGMIFQEPMTCLNPIMTVGDQIAEALPKSVLNRNKQEIIEELLKRVGLSDVKQRAKQFPHQLSGGMKQRVMIAMVLASSPDLLIADEPTTALDVTVQAQILALLKDIQVQNRMGILLITHDLGVVRQVADQVGVMYAGHLVEQATSEEFFKEPLHPYSQQLFAALPNLDKRKRSLAAIKGQVPDLRSSLPACRYADRCPFAWETCFNVTPKWLPVKENRAVRCHLYDPEIKQVHSNTRYQIPTQSLQEATADHPPLLSCRDLKVYFPIKKGLLKRTKGYVKAVDGVEFSLKKGQTLALVGESGCGKTTVGKALVQLIKPQSGEIIYQQKKIERLSSHDLRVLRKDIQIIFQDPFSAMNPRMIIGDIIAEGIDAYRLARSKTERESRIKQLLNQVGLPASSINRYPHEFSGGQRQRICIARALAVEPKIIICDEPTSALDVSVQAQILNLLKKLQQELSLSYLFISHNISVVAYLADEIAVMYLGRIVEQGPLTQVLHHPRHPYTKTLLSSVLSADEQPQKLSTSKDEMPSPMNPPEGCHFHPRCREVKEICRHSYPPMTRIDQTTLNCHLYNEN